MKKSSVGLGAWSILTAGIVVAAGQSGPYYDPSAKDYTLNAQFKNNPPNVISVAGLPSLALTDLEPMLDGAIVTDAAGRIDGVSTRGSISAAGAASPTTTPPM